MLNRAIQAVGAWWFSVRMGTSPARFLQWSAVAGEAVLRAQCLRQTAAVAELCDRDAAEWLRSCESGLGDRRLEYGFTHRASWWFWVARPAVVVQAYQRLDEQWHYTAWLLTFRFDAALEAWRLAAAAPLFARVVPEDLVRRVGALGGGRPPAAE